jgi:hypothetical protein
MSNAGSAMVRDTIYQLKREYGLSATIFQKVSETVDIDTGAVTNNIRFKHIARAIMLPVTLSRTLFQTEYDSNSRIIYIDNSDLGTLVLAKDNWIVFNSKKYLVNDVTTYDNNLATVAELKESLGSDVSSDFEITSEMDLDDSAESELV